jgi:hypothetical protein
MERKEDISGEEFLEMAMRLWRGFCAMFDSEPIVPVPDDSVFHGSENSFPRSC